MKALLLLTASIILIIYGCSISKPLTEGQGEKVFEHNVDLSKAEIKQKLVLFVNEKFVSAKAVIQTNEDGLFTGNGIVTVNESTGMLGETLNITKAELTFVVKYSDNNYRVKWIVKDLLNDKGSYSSDIWGYYAEDIEKCIKRNDDAMYKYLIDKSSEF
jgi:hypothetical protein